MNIIKLDAIDSTNDFLLKMAEKGVEDNFLAVRANFQTKGKGQRGKSWVSKPGENLMFSLYFRPLNDFVMSLTQLNQSVALTILDVLNDYDLPKLAIKWPNDIMSVKHKLGGILIETKLNSTGIKYAVIGIGLNVNQMDFDKEIRATSMLLRSDGKHIHLNELFQSLLAALESVLSSVEDPNQTWNRYNDALFLKNQVGFFENLHTGEQFQAVVKAVNDKHELCLEMDNEVLHTFKHGEIKLLL